MLGMCTATKEPDFTRGGELFLSEPKHIRWHFLSLHLPCPSGWDGGKEDNQKSGKKGFKKQKGKTKKEKVYSINFTIKKSIVIQKLKVIMKS